MIRLKGDVIDSHRLFAGILDGVLNVSAKELFDGYLLLASLLLEDFLVDQFFQCFMLRGIQLILRLSTFPSLDRLDPEL